MKTNQKNFTLKENATEALLAYYSMDYVFPELYLDLIEKKYPKAKLILKNINMKNFENLNSYERDLTPSMDEYYKRVFLLSGKSNFVASWYGYDKIKFFRYVASFPELVKQFDSTPENIWVDVIDESENTNFERSNALKTLGIDEGWIAFFDTKNKDTLPGQSEKQ